MGWIWEEVLPRSGTAVLVGDPLAGKTTLMCLVAQKMSKGGSALAGKRVQKGTVLLCHLEHNEYDLAAKIDRVTNKRGPIDAMFIWRERINIDDPSSIASVTREARNIDARVIVLDSLRAVGIHNENSSADMRRVIQAMQDLTDDGKRLVIESTTWARTGSAR